MILVSPENIKAYTAKGWWAERTLGDTFLGWVEKRPHALAVVDTFNRLDFTDGAAQRWTYAELAWQVGRWCAFLEQQGLKANDLVVVQVPNVVELHAIYLACAVYGVVASPIPVQYRAHEITHVVKATEARVAIVARRVGRFRLAEHWQSIREEIPSVEKILALGEACPPGVISADKELSETVSWNSSAMRMHAARINLSANDVATICWTSGTEGHPKGVPRSHNEWLIVGQGTAEAADLHDGARMLMPFPFTNMAGFASSMAAWLRCGGCVVHHHPFDLNVFIRQLSTEAVEHTVAAPTILAMLLKQPEALEGKDLSRLRTVGCGGSPIPDWLIESFERRFSARIVNLYSSNEGGSLASTPHDVADARTRATLFPRLGVDGIKWTLPVSRRTRTRLVDIDSGLEIHVPGQTGELRFQGPNVFAGYWRSPDATRRAFDSEGFYRSGDLFEIAGPENNFYRYVGRLKDIVIRGGMNISSEEIENLITGHPDIQDASVIGVPDPEMGERVCAVIVPRPGRKVSLEQIVIYLRDECHVAAFKLPERLVTLDEIPRNPTGKALKRELRKQVSTP